MAVISITQNEVSQRREAVTRGVGIRNTAISVVDGITYASGVAVVIYHVRAKWHVAGLKFVQIFAGDQAVHRGA